jgi:hypothetical protein
MSARTEIRNCGGVARLAGQLYMPKWNRLDLPVSAQFRPPNIGSARESKAASERSRLPEQDVPYQGLAEPPVRSSTEEELSGCGGNTCTPPSPMRSIGASAAFDGADWLFGNS